METIVYFVVKLAVVGIVLVSILAYFMHKIGDKEKFTIAIKTIIKMIVFIIAILIALQLFKSVEKTTVDAMNNVGKSGISSSSKIQNKKN